VALIVPFRNRYSVLSYFEQNRCVSTFIRLPDPRITSDSAGTHIRLVSRIQSEYFKRNKRKTTRISCEMNETVLFD
jgi:hypothetical protein